ncbi:hypothetical protein BP6252_08638 [Coleophoma cylindrospora]|uniref:Sensitive to high expression protein 9, mitochondrial n=1 Tax=Coleophoma cylindrospora TaxID=1849047 RepID=A0A3D8R6M7_9HELO|nr:hypothetical protein BP6252_08638 [Coleophoma cylindrospora]
MQPLVRLVPRLAIDSISVTTASRPLRQLRPSIKASICFQCRSQLQRRHFADNPNKRPESQGLPPLDEILAQRKAQPEPAKPPPPSPSPSPSPAPTQSTPKQALEDEQEEELPSSEESRRLALTKRFSSIMDSVQGNIFVASQRLNDLTGYSGIEALKIRITKLEQRVQDAQEAVRTARQTYKTTVAERASTQREVTTLLARKDSWTPTDLERFTSLYRSDHSNEQAVQESATRLADAEREAEHAATTLSSSILARYHEEQIWSDKIRRMSTWGTWGLMGVNVLLFLVFQLGFEPWRRQRLVHGFEEKVLEALELERAKQAPPKDTDDKVDIALDSVVATGAEELQSEVAAGNKGAEPAVDAIVACIEGDTSEAEKLAEPVEESGTADIPTLLMKLRKPQTWKTAVEDLFSERIVSMRKQDVTVVALESAAAGAMLAGIIATTLLRSL